MMDGDGRPVYLGEVLLRKKKLSHIRVGTSCACYLDSQRGGLHAALKIDPNTYMLSDCSVYET